MFPDFKSIFIHFSQSLCYTHIGVEKAIVIHFLHSLQCKSSLNPSEQDLCSSCSCCISQERCPSVFTNLLPPLVTAAINWATQTLCTHQED